MAKVKRSYHQFCGAAKALDVVGERWTLLLVRDLLLGPRRYSALLQGLPGITTNLLAKRLKEMTAAGLIERSGDAASGFDYRLTARGEALEPVVLALGRFGAAYMDAPDPDDRVDMAWSMVALKRRWRGETGDWVAAFHMSRTMAQIRPAGERLETRLGSPWAADVTVSGEDDAFRDLFLRGASVAALIAAGRLCIEGDAAVWARCREALGLA